MFSIVQYLHVSCLIFLTFIVGEKPVMGSPLIPQLPLDFSTSLVYVIPSLRLQILATTPHSSQALVSSKKHCILRTRRHDTSSPS